MKQTELFRVAMSAAGIPRDQAEAVMRAYEQALATMTEAKLQEQGHAELLAKLERAFNFKNPAGRMMTATEVCQLVGMENPSRSETMAMGKALAALTKRPGRKSNGRVVYSMPRA